MDVKPYTRFYNSIIQTNRLYNSIISIDRPDGSIALVIDLSALLDQTQEDKTYVSLLQRLLDKNREHLNRLIYDRYKNIVQYSWRKEEN